MKTICAFIFSTLLLINCSAQTENELIINYKATTRGSSVTLIVNSSEIIYISNNKHQKFGLSESQWNQINNIVSEINLNTIHKLDPPSSESATDKALIASLFIQKENQVYTSSTFDHGNPPKELEKLIHYLLKISD